MLQFLNHFENCIIAVLTCSLAEQNQQLRTLNRYANLEKVMYRFPLIALLILIPFLSVPSQVPDVNHCPPIEIVGSQGVISFNDKIDVSVELRDGLGLLWKVSNGSIVTGQGTPKVKLAPDDSSNANLLEMEVTLEVTGLDRACHSSVYATFYIQRPVDFFPIDEYENHSPADERTRLTNLSILLSQQGPATAYLVLGLLPRQPVSVLRKRVDGMKRFLFGRMKMLPDSVVFLVSRADRPLTSLWIVPKAAPSPWNRICSDCTVYETGRTF